MTETENVCLTCGGSGVYEFSRHHPSCTGGDDLTTCLSLCPVLDQEECPDSDVIEPRSRVITSA